jgi:phosphatidylethanolamine/phosphatidyl-N-methylethanolamine N-methyltransferase
MEKRAIQEKQFWDKFATKYDRFMQRFAAVYTQLIPLIQEQLKPVDHVLEIATGTGIIALGISEHVSKVTAIDISEPMINIAREKARSEHIDNVEFEVQDGYSLSFYDNQFDTCLIVNALHVMQQPEIVIQEIRRVLKPAGRLIAPTYCHGENLKSHLVSRIMGLLGFKAYSRFSVQSLSDFLTMNGFHINDTHIYAGTPPLAFIVAEKREYQMHYFSIVFRNLPKTN